MRFVAGLILLVLVAGAACERVSYSGYRVFRVIPRDDAEAVVLSRLRNSEGVDFWSQGLHPGVPADIMVAPHRQRFFAAFLKAQNLSSTILIDNVERVLEQENNRQQEARKAKSTAVHPRIEFDQFYTYDEIVDYLEELAAEYPSLVTVSYPGTSYEGRPIAMATVSSGGGGSRRAVLIDAGIHAREWLAPSAALYILNQLVENNTANAALTDNVDWLIIPVLNPDGYEYTFTDDRLWRKTRSILATSTCIGTDGNRNFDFHWGESGVSTDPCEEDYLGPEPFSESEARALSNASLSNQGRVTLYLALHSYGPYFLYPWSYDVVYPDNWIELDDLANQANDANVAAGGESFVIGNSAAVLYASAGSSDDWNMGVGGVPLAYTAELPGGGDNGFDLPASEILMHVVPFFEAIRVFGEYVAQRE